jgi:hypothetical protein
MSWTIVVLIICFLLAVFAVWKEYRRKSKAHLILRIVAVVLVVVALARIILPISYSKTVFADNGNSVVLLTDGFGADSLANYKTDKVLTTDKEITKKYAKARLIRLDELKNDTPLIAKIHMFGYGLNEDELNELGDIPVQLHKNIPNGIISIDWSRNLKAGETLKVQGKYRNNLTQAVKISLIGLNTKLDTATIAAKTDANFELSTVPKSEGRVVYHLLAMAGKDTIANESMPAQIDPVKPLKVLVLSASPDFETRFLKNWLSENGFSVAVRSAISKEKFSTEYVNIEPLKLDRLSDDLLEKFDLVIGDLSVLKSESALLRQQVSQKGLGLIFRADSSSKSNSWLQNDFPVERLNLKEQPTVNLDIRNKKSKSASLKIDPTFIRFQRGTQPLVNDMQNRILVSSAIVGAGREAFSILHNTYNWVLAGNKDDYSAFWSSLISGVARKAPVTEEWSVGSKFPVVGQPVTLRLATSAAPGKVDADQSVIAPAQNAAVPFEWAHTFWPDAVGWHSIRQVNGQPGWYYVFGRDEWRSARAMENLAATNRYAEKYGANEPVTKPIHEKVRIEVPKIYFYLLLLMACVFLWVEAKGFAFHVARERT